MKEEVPIKVEVEVHSVVRTKVFTRDKAMASHDLKVCIVSHFLILEKKYNIPKVMNRAKEIELLLSLHKCDAKREGVAIENGIDLCSPDDYEIKGSQQSTNLRVSSIGRKRLDYEEIPIPKTYERGRMSLLIFVMNLLISHC